MPRTPWPSSATEPPPYTPLKDSHRVAHMRSGEASPRSLWLTAPRRIVLGLAAASLAGALAAAIDARWAADASAGWWSVVRRDAGLLGPLALGWGGLVAVFALVLQPSESTSVRTLWRALDVAEAATRRRAAGVGLVSATFVLIWATATAHLGQRIMSSGSAQGSAGLTLAVLTALLATTTAVCAVAMADLLAAGLRHADAELDPRLALLLGTALGAGLLGYGVASGDTSGQGGWLGIWGVLKRPELDLRGPGLLGLIGVTALLLPAALRFLPRGARWSLPSCPCWSHGERRAGWVTGLSLSAIEHGAPLGGPSLNLLRRAFDRESRRL